MASLTNIGNVTNVEVPTEYCQGCTNLKDNEEKLHNDGDALKISYVGVSGEM
jgi:hypothetical protein